MGWDGMDGIAENDQGVLSLMLDLANDIIFSVLDEA